MREKSLLAPERGTHLEVTDRIAIYSSGNLIMIGDHCKSEGQRDDVITRNVRLTLLLHLKEDIDFGRL